MSCPDGCVASTGFSKSAIASLFECFVVSIKLPNTHLREITKLPIQSEVAMHL